MSAEVGLTRWYDFSSSSNAKAKAGVTGTGDEKFERLLRNKGKHWLCQDSKELSLLGATQSMRNDWLRLDENFYLV